MKTCKILTHNDEIIIPDFVQILNQGLDEIEDLYKGNQIKKARRIDVGNIISNLNNKDKRFVGHFTDDYLDGILIEKQDEAYTDTNDIGWLVAKEKGKGIGSKLLLDCIERTKQRNQKFLALGVSRYNEKAIDFYKKHGFEFDIDYDEGNMLLFYKNLEGEKLK
tara:strand:- start:1422 stop:1913 length:492 start_codon:yes stop_codon:yes gene_type:complete